MGKYLIAQYSDLSGAKNPTGIWSVSYLRLKQMLNAGASAAELVRALHAWMRDQKIPLWRLRGILKEDPGKAYEELCALVNKAMKPGSMPPDWDSTLRRLLSVLAAHESRKLNRSIASQQAHLAKFKTETALKLVNRLVG
jgi:hypothetical protein